MTLLFKMQKTVVTFSLTLMPKVRGYFSYSCGGEVIQTYLN